MRVALITLTAAVSNTWLKWVIAQPRPYYVNGNIQALRATPGFGMPSGHAQGVAALWGAVGWQFHRSWLWALALLVVVMTGLSRVYLGVHSVSQVLVGWIIGGLCIWLVLAAEKAVLVWLRKISLFWQILFATLFVALMMAVSVVMLQLKSDFTVPAVWLENFVATVARTGDQQNLSLYDPRVLMIFGLIYGVLLMGLYFLKTGALEVVNWRQRVLNLIIGCAALALFFWLLSLLDFDNSASSNGLIFLLLTAQPWLTIVLPLKLAERFTVPSD